MNIQNEEWKKLELEKDLVVKEGDYERAEGILQQLIAKIDTQTISPTIEKHLVDLVLFMCLHPSPPLSRISEILQFHDNNHRGNLFHHLKHFIQAYKMNRPEQAIEYCLKILKIILLYRESSEVFTTYLSIFTQIIESLFPEKESVDLIKIFWKESLKILLYSPSEEIIEEGTQILNLCVSYYIFTKDSELSKWCLWDLILYKYLTSSASPLKLSITLGYFIAEGLQFSSDMEFIKDFIRAVYKGKKSTIQQIIRQVVSHPDHQFLSAPIVNKIEGIFEIKNTMEAPIKPPPVNSFAIYS